MAMGHQAAGDGRAGAAQHAAAPAVAQSRMVAWPAARALAPRVPVQRLDAIGPAWVCVAVWGAGRAGGWRWFLSQSDQDALALARADGKLVTAQEKRGEGEYWLLARLVTATRAVAPKTPARPRSARL